ncbi:MAG: porin [Paracoccaceae bacterium]
MRRALAALPAVLVAAAAPAAVSAAEPVTVSVGGYLHAGAGYANPVGEDEDLGVFRDGEIHFKAVGTSDIGLTFRAQVELEGFTSGDQIDENWVSVSGAFGNVLIGGADTALNEQGGVGVVKPSGSWANYYDYDGGGNLPGEPGGFVGEDDSLGLRYWIEAFGFEVGASWQPRVGADGGADSNILVTSRPPLDDQFAFGGNWSGEVSDVSIRVGGGYMFNDEEDFAHAGAELGYGGLTVAGFWNVEDEFGSFEVNRYSGGAMYETGPWSFGGGAVWSDFDRGGDEEFYHLGAGYDLAPGVTLFGAVQYGEDQAGRQGAGGYGWINLRF